MVCRHAYASLTFFKINFLVFIVLRSRHFHYWPSQNPPVVAMLGFIKHGNMITPSLVMFAVLKIKALPFIKIRSCCLLVFYTHSEGIIYIGSIACVLRINQIKKWFIICAK